MTAKPKGQEKKKATVTSRKQQFLIKDAKSTDHRKKDW